MLLDAAALGAVSSLVAAVISLIPWFDTPLKRNILAIVVLIVAGFTYGGFTYTTLAAFWSFFLQAAVYAFTTYAFVLENVVVQPARAAIARNAKPKKKR